MEHALLAMGSGMLVCCMLGKNSSNTHIIIGIIIIACICLYIHCTEGARPPPVRDEYASAFNANMCQAQPSKENTPVSSEQPKPKFHFDNVAAKPHEFAYTDKEMQERRDEFVFRKVLTHPTSESRSRVLAAMYQELVESSVKKDPALRPTDKNSDAEQCSPLRGLKTRDII